MALTPYLELTKKRYLDDLNAKGITLNSNELDELNSFILKRHSQDLGLTGKPTAATVSNPSPSPPKTTPGYVPASGIGQALANVGKTPSVSHDSNMLDKLGVGLWYGLESYTWEAPGFILKQFGVEEPYKFEELSPGEKATAVAAGGGALFLPGLGGFRGLAKGLSWGASKLSSKGVLRNALNIADETAAKAPAVLRGLSTRVRDAAGRFIKPDLISKNVRSSLRKASKAGASSTNQSIIALKAADDGAKLAREAIHENARTYVMKGLQEAAKKGSINMSERQMSQLAERISGDFIETMVNASTKGNLAINNISHWVKNWIGGEAPGAVRDALSKYLGMAVQDAAMLGIHSMATSWVEAATQDENWEAGGALGSAMIMSATFPLVRAVGPKGSGDKSMREGFRYLYDRFRNTNYKKIANNGGGEEQLRWLFNMKLKGGQFDIANSSRLMAHSIEGTSLAALKANPHTVMNMPIDKLVRIMKKADKLIAGDALKKWGTSYPIDFMKSLPRMAVGVGAMNWEIFHSGAFDHMDTEELLAHMAMGALFTKSRGEWGAKESHARIVDLQKYYNTMRTVGMKPDQMEAMFKSYTEYDMMKFVSGHADGSKVFSIFDKYVGKEKLTNFEFGKEEEHVRIRQEKGKKKGRIKFDPISDENVAKFATMYNAFMMSQHGNQPGKVKPLIVSQLTREQLNAIKGDLDKVVFSDGTKLGELGFVGTKAKLSELMGIDIEKAHMNLLRRLGEAGLSVSISEEPGIEPIIGDIGGPKDGKTNPYIARIKVMLDRLEKYNLISITQDTKIEVNEDYIKKVKGKTPEQLKEEGLLDLDKIERIVEEFEQNLPKEIYGKDFDYIMSGDISHNIFIDAMEEGKIYKSMNKLYDFMVERNVKQGDGTLSFLENFKNWFYNAGRPMKDWNVQIEFKRDKKPQGVKEEEEFHKRQEEEFILMKEKLGEVHEMKSQSETNREVHTNIVRMTKSELQQVFDEYKNTFGKFPEDMYTAGIHRVGVEYFVNRFLDKKGIPNDIAQVIRDGLSRNYLMIDEVNNKILGWSTDAIIHSFESSNPGSSTTGIGAEAIKAHGKLMRDLKSIGKKGDVVFQNAVFTKDSQYKMPTPREILEIQEARNSKAIESLGNEISSVISTINNRVPGMDRPLEKIQDLVNGLDTAERPIQDMSEISKEMDSLTAIFGTKGGQFYNKELAAELEIIRDNVNGLSKALDKAKDEKGISVVWDTTLLNTVGDLMLPIKVGIDRIVTEEYLQRDRLRMILAELYSYTASDAISMADAIRHRDNLQRGLIRLLSEETKMVRLDELINKFDEYQSYYNARKILDNIENDMKGRGFDVERGVNRNFDEARDRLKSFLQEHQRRDDLKSPLKIAQEWGFTDKDNPNKIDGEIIDAIRKGGDTGKPGDELIRKIREVMDKESRFIEMSPDKRDKALLKFIKDDALTLLAYVENHRKIGTMRIEQGHIVYDNNVPTQWSPSVQFFSRFKRLWMIDGHGTRARLGGKPGQVDRFSINAFGDNKRVQGFFDDILTGETGSVMNEFAYSRVWNEIEVGKPWNQRNVDNAYIEGRPKVINGKSPTIMRIGGQIIAFENSKDNLKELNNSFDGWYDRNFNSLAGSMKDSFENMWGELRSNSDTRTGIKFDAEGYDGKNSDIKNELKMTALFIDDTMNKRWVEEYLDPAVFGNQAARQKWEAKLFQRSFIVRGGTSQAVTKNIINFMLQRSRTFNNSIRRAARHYRDNGVNQLIIKDEDVNGQWDRESPFYGYSVAIRSFEAIAANPMTAGEGARARRMIEELEYDMSLDAKDPNKKYPSLDASSIDGIKYVSEQYARFLWAVRGKDPNEFNGMKPYTFHNNDLNSLVAKGYYVYDRTVAVNMPQHVDVVMGESAAKIFNGESLMAGRNVEPYNMRNNRNEWTHLLTMAPNNHILNTPIESVGLGILNVSKTTTSKSHSITDYTDVNYGRETRIWQELDKILDDLHHIDIARRDGANGLAEIMFESKQQEGHQYTQGAAGLLQNLLEVGVNASNPIARVAINRLLRGPLINTLRTANSKYAIDAMIAPDMDGTLTNPTFGRVRNTDGDVIDRIQLSLGGVKGPSDLRTKVLKNIDRATFVFSINGVDYFAGVNTRGEVKITAPDDNMNTGDTILFGRDASGDKEWYIDRGPVRNGQTLYERQDKPLVEKFLRTLNTVAQEEKGKKGILFGDIFDAVELFSSRYITTTRPLGRTASTAAWRDAFTTPEIERLRELNIGLTTRGLAIPRKGHDLVPHRLEGIGITPTTSSSHSDGKLTKINIFEQRVAHQRDNDGDRFYLHYDVGIDMMTKDRQRYARVTDYKQLPKESADIDMFGLGPDGVKAGSSPRVGFGDYQREWEAQKMAVGSAMSLKSALTTLSNLQFGLTRYGNRHGLIDIANIPYSEAGITDASKAAARQWKAVERIFRFNQSSVDTHAGTNAIAKAGRDAIIDAMLFGDMPVGKGATKELAEEFSILAENSLFGEGKKEWSRGEKAVVKEVLGIIRKSSMMFNDVYDEGGSRIPEDYELKKSYNNLRQIFADREKLNGEIFNRVFIRAGNRGDSELQKSVYKLFFSGDNALPPLRDVLKGGLDLKIAMSAFFKFGVGTPGGKIFTDKVLDFGYDQGNSNKNQRLRNRLRTSNAGYILNDIVGARPAFKLPGHVWGDIPMRDRSKIGLMTGDFLRGIEMLAHLKAGQKEDGKPHDVDIKGLTFNDIVQDAQFDLYKAFDHRVSLNVNNDQKRGIIKQLLENELNILRRELRYKKGEPWKVNQSTMDRLESRLVATDRAIRHVEELGKRDMVKDFLKLNISFHPGESRPGIRNTNRRIDVKNATHVYRMFGDQSNASKWFVEGDPNKIKLNLKNLKFVKSVPKGDWYLREPGYTYIESKNPVARTSMDADQLRYWYSLLYKTAGFDPYEHFSNRTVANDFLVDAANLQREITQNVLDSQQLGRTNRSLKRNPLPSITRSKDQFAVDRFMKKYLIDSDVYGPHVDISMVNQELLEGMYRYLLKPKSVEGFYRVTLPNDNKVDIPTFRGNERVINVVTEWMFNNKFDRVVQNVMEGWEGKSRGGEFDTEYHQDLMKRSYSQDYYNTYLSPELGNLASRLSEWSDPIWNRFINDRGGIIEGKEFIVHELDGIDRYLRMLYKNKIDPNNCRN